MRYYYTYERFMRIIVAFILNLFNKTKKITMTATIIIGILGGIGGTELLVIALIILLLFGGKKIPEMMKGLGKGIKEFKDSSNGINSTTPDEQKGSNT